MNKKNSMIVVAIAAVLLLGGGVSAIKRRDKDNAAMKKTEETAAMMKQEAANGMKHDEAMAKDTTVAADAMKKEEASAATHGTYVTLADYNANASKFADSKKVYFFHASWCPICKGINAEIEADITKVPAGVTIIKTDFDTSLDLRKKYGVTTQYTFVQFDGNGTQLAKWSATSLSAAVAGVKS